MKKSIKISALIISTALLFSGCAHKTHSESTVSASFYPIYLISSFIAFGSGLEIKNTASPQTGCLHDYQLTTGNIRQLAQSDVLIINGGGMEDAFVEKASENENIKIIDSSAHFEEHEHEEHEEHENEEEASDGHDHDHGENSHYWMSLSHAQMQAEEIAQGLSQIHPEKALQFENNLEIFKANCRKLSEKYSFSSYNTANVISFHEAFEYLCEENNVNIVKTFEIDENSVPSARELADAVDEGIKHNVSAVICADDSGKAYARTTADELGVPLVVLNPITYVNEETASYFEAMDKNFSLLKEVFKND